MDKHQGQHYIFISRAATPASYLEIITMIIRHLSTIIYCKYILHSVGQVLLATKSLLNPLRIFSFLISPTRFL